MAINRYDEAAPIQYVSQYVPIPFSELFAMSKYYGDEIKAARKELNEHLKTVGEFSSPSLIDTENYRKEAVGRLEPFIDEAAANPALMKSAAWRSQMLNQLNAIDYGLLHRMKKTAENAQIREKAKAALKAEGLYEEWFDDDMYRDLSNWDTQKYGIMTSLSPDKYVSMEELGTKYTKDLKPTFYKGKAPNSGQSLPFHNWLAVSSTDIRRQFEDHAQDLLSTDAGAKHYGRVRQLLKSQNPNISEEQIMETFIDALTVEQSDKLIETPVLDSASLQLSLANISAETKRRTAGTKKGSSDDALPYIFPTAVSRDQQDEIARRAKKIEQINPSLSNQINSDNTKWVEELVNFFGEIAKDTDVVRAMEALSIDLENEGLLEEVKKAQEDPTFLNAYVSGIMQYLPQDAKYDYIRQKYNVLQGKLAQNAYNHNQQTSSAIVSNTLSSYIADAVPGIDSKYKQNPWLSIFEQPSNAQLNAIDAAALSTLETNLNTPEQDIIARALFGDDKKISSEMLKRNADSSFEWITKNFQEQAAAIEDAKKQTNYTRSGSPVTEITGGWFNRNINASADESYSIRDNVAKGLYGSVEIVSVDGFTPVLDPATGTTDQYTYRLTVRIPLEHIDKDIAKRYNTWMDESVIDNNTISEDTGLHTEMDNGVEYVHVPIFINRQLNSNTKIYMDALYRQSIDDSNDLKTANEIQAALANPGARSFN